MLKMSNIILLITTFLVISSCSTSIQDQLSTRAFSFNYSVSVGSTEGKKLEIWIPLPSSNEVQTISNIKINSSDMDYTMEEEDQFGNKYLYIVEENGTNERKDISIDFDVIRNEHKNVNYKNVDISKNLMPFSMVPIGNIFDTVIKDNKLNKDDVEGIYRFVLNGMHYGKPKSTASKDEYYAGVNPKTNLKWLPEDSTYGLKEVSLDEVVSYYTKAKAENSTYTFANGNSIYACDIGVGNCTDYHSYFMSLTKTLDIPSRFHMGFSIPTKSSSGVVGGYHCWADYYVENEGWYPVDISEADKDPSKADYFFGTVNENRFEMNVGRDFILKGYDGGPLNLFIYPIMEVDDLKSDNYKKGFSFENKVWQ